MSCNSMATILNKSLIANLKKKIKGDSGAFLQRTTR